MFFSGQSIAMSQAAPGWWEVLVYSAVLLLAAAVYCLRTWFKCALAVYRLPGPPSLPLLGHAHLVTDYKALRNLGSICHRVYGPLMKVWIAFYPTVFVISPHCLQKILSSNKHTEKLFFYKLMDNFLGKGLVTSGGSTWRLHRKLLQPSFKQSVLEQFLPAFHDGSQRLVRRFQGVEAPVNVVSHMNQTVLEILNDAILGVRAEDTARPRADGSSPFRNAKVLVPHRIAHPWLMLDWVYRRTAAARSEDSHRASLGDFAREIIRKRKEEREAVNNKSNNNMQKEVQKTRFSLLDRMLDISDNNPDFDEEAIVDEVCTFMLAGQESVATAMSFCVFLLAQHQDALRRVEEEVLGLPDRAPSLQDLQDMRYLEQCIKEALRLYPSIPILGRKLAEDVCMGKHTLPAGCGVFICPFATHRIAEIFPDPEKFDPDRFLPENVQKMHPYAYTAFSAGPRNCIGKTFALLEMKTLLSALVRRYEILPAPGKDRVDLAYRVTLRARGGLWVQFRPRRPA
ncbi:probable cytochrome P450 4aa1 [Bacillus rossius redtenbacheri]|uniref:probable cytochrome P450 4aa1 n=1 Tax=Bacillus rossius redtenbacheri TaxID=93214 RepID=UPI002FDE207F